MLLEELHAANPAVRRAAPDGFVQVGRVEAFGVERFRGDRPLEFGIEEDEVSRIAGIEAAAGKTEDLGGLFGHEADEVGLGDDAVPDQRPDEREREVEPRDAVGREVECGVLSMAMCGAWSVTMMSMVPFFTASRMASRSSGVLKGGLTLARVL